MAKTKISEFDVDPALNTDINSINIAEGCAPSGINNAIRQLMSDLKEFQTGAGGDSITAVGVYSDTIGEKTSAAGVTVDGVLIKDNAVTASGGFSGALNGAVGGTTPAAGAFTTLSASGAFSANGGATLGDASGDALTINSSAVSIPNGLNFGSNNLVLSSGNVGIGVTPYGWGAGQSPTFDLGSGGLGFYSAGMQQNSYYNGSNWIYKTTNAAAQYLQSGGQHRWYVAPSGTAGNAISFTQAMTLDSSGNLFVGTTSSSPSSGGLAINPNGQGANTSALVIFNKAYAPTSAAQQFQYNGSVVGSISYTSSATTYSTSSDYRLKENITPMTGALNVVSALKPVTYKWKVDGSDGQGFIAHELQAVVPDCVTGEKDAVDADGNPQYQGIDTSFLVATLTAAIQELKAQLDESNLILTSVKTELDTVKAEVTALKGTA